MPDVPITIWDRQAEFVSDEHRFSAFVAGIGAGKTIAGAIKSVLFATQIMPGKTGMIVAPTWRMVGVAKLEFEKACERILEESERPTWHSAPGVQGKMDANFPCGSIVQCRSAEEPEHLRGPSVSWIWPDESALLKALAWKILLGRVREDGTAGYIWPTTTPRGRNWLYQEFVANGTEDHHVIHARTAANPFLSQSYIDAMRHSYQGRFAAQELEGEFVGWEGLVYESFDLERNVRPITPEELARINRRAIGLDWGFASPGCALLCGTDGRTHYVVAERYETRLQVRDEHAAADWHRHLIQLERYRGNVQPPTIWCDPSMPGNVSALVGLGHDARQADNAITPGVQRCASIVPRLVVDPNCTNYLREIQSYCYPERDGQVSKDLPVKQHDHAMDAWRYAVAGLLAEAEEVWSYG